MTEEVLSARVLVASAERVHEGGGVVVEGGLVRRVLAGPGEVARAARAAGRAAQDLGERVLTAGLVNAHAHLELGALAGHTRGDGTFAAWIGEVVAARAALADAAPLERAARDGAQRLVRGGTTSVGDIDSSGAAERAHARAPLRVRLYREVLDLDLPERRAAALARLDAPFAPGAPLSPDAAPSPGAILPGVSPHAPYTVGPRLLDEVAARFAREPAWACSLHWAETDEETAWLAHGGGPLAELLGALDGRRANDLARLAELGLLGPRTSLVHVNHASAADLDRIAASGAAIVHCPGTHAFFGRAPFAFDDVLARGIPLALGTDSLASNAELDLLRELALVRRSAPALDPRAVWRAATEGGARALGCAGRAGVLAPGAWADLAAFETRETSARGVLEALTGGAARAAGTWVAGRAVPGCGPDAA